MQDFAYLIVGNETIYVLRQSTTDGIRLKKRKGPKPQGKYLDEESDFLSEPENWTYVQALHDGKTITL
jgi:hypothetical protein